MTQHIINLGAKFITVKIYRAKLAKGKGTLEKSSEESGHKLRRVLFQEVVQMPLTPH